MTERNDEVTPEGDAEPVKAPAPKPAHQPLQVNPGEREKTPAPAGERVTERNPGPQPPNPPTDGTNTEATRPDQHARRTKRAQ